VVFHMSIRANTYMCYASLHLIDKQVMRVFYDRLVDEEEQVWFLDTLKQATSRYFRTNFDTLFAHLASEPGGAAVPPGRITGDCSSFWPGRVYVEHVWKMQAGLRLRQHRHVRASPFTALEKLEHCKQISQFYLTCSCAPSLTVFLSVMCGARFYKS